MKGSFNDQVREKLGQTYALEQIFSTRQAGDVMELSTPERKRLGAALHDLCKYGELEALGQGRWRRLGREGRPELRVIMWRLLRISLVMTAEDLVRQSGASPRTVAEFFQTMMRQGLVVNEEQRQNQPGRYRLLKDPGPEPPADGVKAAKLRARRQRQKEALAALDAAFNAVAAARLAVSELEG